MFQKLRKLNSKIASIQLAIFIMSGLTVLIAAGTVIESKYDAWTANQLVYLSIWMKFFLSLLVVNLTAVIIDRFPWKKRHLSFIFAHLGIIIIIFGAYLTHISGIDGTLTLNLNGEANKNVVVRSEEIVLYRSPDGSTYQKVHSDELKIISNPIQIDKPYLINTKDLKIEIVESIPYSLSKRKIEPTTQKQSGAAIRFMMFNANVSNTEWLVQRNNFDKAELQLGPVLITLGGLWERNKNIHEIRFQVKDEQLHYAIYDKNKLSPDKVGVANDGFQLNTGWMNLSFKVLAYYPHAISKYEAQKLKQPTPLSTSALRVKYNGEETYLFLNDYIKIFTDTRVYLLAYMQKKLPLDFEMSLRDFKKTNYPGSMKAMAYESHVSYADSREAVISMNNPLNFANYYFYQASFNEAPNGAITESVLSVNYDPGRIWKYMGSLLMSIGIILLFFKKKFKI